MNPSSWVVSTLSGSREGYVDGICSVALFRAPSSFAFSSHGHLYVADRTNHAIRKIDLEQRMVTTLCNQGLEQPVGIVWHPDGYFLVSDRGSHKIHRITTLGELSTFTGTQLGFADGQQTVARFNSPTSLCLTSEGSCYVCDLGNDRIRLLSKDGSVSTYAGSRGGYLDGPCDKALFSHPWDMCLSSYGEIYVCDWGNNRIRVIDTYKRTVSSITTKNVDSLPDSPASLNCPISVVLTPQYDLLVADRNNHRIRYLRRPSTAESSTSISASSSSSSSVWEMTTFSGSVAGLVDGNCATEAKFKNLLALAWTPSGQLCISSNDCIRLAEQAEKKDAMKENTDLSTSLGVLLEDGACSDFSFTSSSSGRIFALHQPILVSRCTSLMNPSTWQALGSLHLEDGSWEAFWNFLYLDVLPSPDSVVGFEQHWSLALDYCDVYILAHICQLHSLERYCSAMTKKLVFSARSLLQKPQTEHHEDDSSLSQLLQTLSLRNVSASHPVVTLIVDILIDCSDRKSSNVVSAIGTALRGSFELQQAALAYANSALQNQPPHSSSSSSPSTTSQLMASPIGSLFTQLSSIFPLEIGDSNSNSLPQRRNVPSAPPDYAVIVDGVSFPCHKSILYARWPYFRFMMIAGLAEASEGAATFPGPSDDGLSPAAMHALLWFFYSNRPNLFTHATGLELLACASRFRFSDMETNAANSGFEDLLKYCAIPIHLTPTKENAISLHKLAVRYNNEEMRKITETTILCNLPSIFSEPKLKAEFEQLDMEEKYRLLKEAFSILVHAPEKH